MRSRLCDHGRESRSPRARISVAPSSTALAATHGVDGDRHHARTRPQGCHERATGMSVVTERLEGAMDGGQSRNQTVPAASPAMTSVAVVVIAVKAASPRWVRMQAPLSRSQSFSVRSWDGETTRRPSGVTAHAVTRPAWPRRWRGHGRCRDPRPSASCPTTPRPRAGRPASPRTRSPRPCALRRWRQRSHDRAPIPSGFRQRTPRPRALRRASPRSPRGTNSFAETRVSIASSRAAGCIRASTVTSR